VQSFGGAGKETFVSFLHEDALSVAIVVPFNNLCVLFVVLLPVCTACFTHSATAWMGVGVSQRLCIALDHDDALQLSFENKQSENAVADDARSKGSQNLLTRV
jgi:hypothetical protein